MSLYILDTDHITLHQRNHLPLHNRLSKLSKGCIAVTIVSVEEQIKGRFAYLNRQGINLAQGYKLLVATTEYFCNLTVLPFSDSAQSLYEGFRQQKIRVGKLDSRIAAIVMDQNAILLTRNRKDFERIPGLNFEDWST